LNGDLTQEARDGCSTFPQQPDQVLVATDGSARPGYRRYLARFQLDLPEDENYVHAPGAPGGHKQASLSLW
jgi:hypothetical protein